MLEDTIMILEKFIDSGLFGLMLATLVINVASYVIRVTFSANANEKVEFDNLVIRENDETIVEHHYDLPDCFYE